MTKPRSLTELRYRETRHEIVATLSGVQHRLGFTSRASRVHLLEMAREHAELILPHVGDDDTASYSTRFGLRLGPNVRIHLSGLTERECALNDIEDAKETK